MLHIGGQYYSFLSLPRRLPRPGSRQVGWAKSAFGIIAVIGIAVGVVRLAWDLGWFTVGSEAGRRLDDYLYMVSGVILGFLFSLILSGQLSGTKRDL